MRRGDKDFEAAVAATIGILRGKINGARARNQPLPTYGELSKDLSCKGYAIPAHQGSMSLILEAASDREAAAGRGLISAIVVDRVNARPRSGFFKLARRVPHKRTGDDISLWTAEVQRLFAEDAQREGRKVRADRVGAWLLKCRPDIWNLRQYIEDGYNAIDRPWSVGNSYRTHLMTADQPVLFWVTGPDTALMTPGLWGYGELTGGVEELDAGDDPGYWLDENQRLASKLYAPIDVHLLRTPVPRAVLRQDPRLKNLEILTAPKVSNPLVVTPEELAAILSYIPTTAEVDRVTDAAVGAGYASSLLRKEVELKAVAAVTRRYVAQGWSVVDVSEQNLGWDLTCTSAKGEVHEVEVKGVSGFLPIIVLTRNEAAAAETRATWRLAIVTSTRSTPHVTVVDGASTLGSATPLAYQVKLSS